MQFKIDENLPVEAARLLRSAGHDTLTVHEQHLAGATDVTIATVCQSELRTILTLDTDFADIRTYPPQNYAGIIVLRIGRHDKPHVLAVLQRVTLALATESVEQRLWIVDEQRIRVRE